MENNERRMHSDFVVGDDESMSEAEGAEPPQAMYARQQIDAAAALFDMPRAERLKQLEDPSARNTLRRLALQETSRPASVVPSRPASVVPSPAMRRPSSAMRRPPPQLGPSAEEEAMADEAQEFAEDTHAANERDEVECMAAERAHAEETGHDARLERMEHLEAQGVQGAVEPPADHISVQDFIDNGTFDDVMQDLASQNFEAMLNPPTYDGHD